MAEIKWIKLATGLPDNKKIKQIRTLPNGDTIALMWVFLMCLAGDTNDDGLVYFTSEIPYTDEMLAEEFRMDINTVRLALSTFQRFGMIEISDNMICLAAWEKWQSVDRLSEIREQTRKRVAKHRAKQKLTAGNVTSNVTVTYGNATEEEREEEREEDKEQDIEGESNKADKPPRATRFTPPTLEEVTAYCREKAPSVDPQRFIDFYSSKGWMVGKNKMKDWRAAVRGWQARDNEANRQAETRRQEAQDYGDPTDFYK